MIYFNYYDAIDGLFKVASIKKELIEEFTSNLYLLNIKQGLIVDKKRCFNTLKEAIEDLKKDRIKNYIIMEA